MSTMSGPNASTERPSGDELLERARDLVPVLAARARATEDLRRIPDETIADLHAAQLFEAFSPRSAGGLGFGMREYGNVVRILAGGCASTAWVYGFLVAHNTAIVRDTPQLLDERGWAAAAATTGIQGLPSGLATPVEGGWRISGTWKFASGIMNSDHILLITWQDNGDEPPSVLGVITDVADGTVEDVWHFAGMKGTGSNSYRLDDVFVPTDRAWGVFGLPQINPPVADSGFNLSIVRLLGVVLAGTALGCAEAALDAFRQRVLTRTIGYGQGPQREHREAWARYADALMQVRVTRLLWDDIHRLTIDLADSGRTNTVDEGAYAHLASGRMCSMARDAIQTIVEGSGSSIYHLDDPLQRQQRDVDTLKSHSVLHWDGAATAAGAALLGLADPLDALVAG